MKQLKISTLQNVKNTITSFFFTQKLHSKKPIYHDLLHTKNIQAFLSNIWSSKTTLTFHNKKSK
jgi:hypothetical protein